MSVWSWANALEISSVNQPAVKVTKAEWNQGET